MVGWIDAGWKATRKATRKANSKCHDLLGGQTVRVGRVDWHRGMNPQTTTLLAAQVPFHFLIEITHNPQQACAQKASGFHGHIRRLEFCAANHPLPLLPLERLDRAIRLQFDRLWFDFHFAYKLGSLDCVSKGVPFGRPHLSVANILIENQLQFSIG